MVRFTAALVLLIAILAAAIAARPSPPRADFSFVNSGDVNTLDPARMTWISDTRVARLLYEPLLRNDALRTTFDIVPAAAERFEVSADGLEYTFVLREDGRWSNGEPVTAEQFVFAWRRAMLPDVGSKSIAFLTLIEGAQAFFDWRVEALAAMSVDAGDERNLPRPYASGDALWAATEDAFSQMVRLEARGDRELWLRLERPVPYFPEIAAMVQFAPLYPPLIDAYERPDPVTGRLRLRQGWTKPGRLISNGPFTLDAWAFKDEMRLAASTHYWDGASVNLGTIAIRAIDDPGAAVLALKTGAVDFVPDVSASYRAEIYAAKRAFREEHAASVARLEQDAQAEFGVATDPFTLDRLLPEDPRAFLHTFPVFGTYFYNFNCSEILPDGRPNPFADARVRRAFAMTIDKPAITDAVRRLGEPVAGTLVPPGSLAKYLGPVGLPDVGSAAADSERSEIVRRARGLLADAGYENPSEDFPVTVEIVFNKDMGHDLIAQVAAKSWQRHLGVAVRLAQKELKVYRNDLKNKNFMIARAGWYGDYPDPMTFLEINESRNGNNDRGFSSERYDALLARANASADADERLRLLADAERMIVEEELPLIPIFHYVDVLMFNPHRVTGLNAHPRGQQNLYLVDVLGDGVGADVFRPVLPGTAEAGAP
ncbi:MAG: peptide ABC transporter substrate-binding protein [Planctomycetota bacterium]